MLGFIRRLPWGAELAVVIGGAFGYFIYVSLVVALSAGPVSPLGESDLWFVIVYETVIGGALLFFLWARGWSHRAFGAVAYRGDVLAGLGLALAITLWFAFLHWSISKAWPSYFEAMRDSRTLASGIKFNTIVGFSLVNGVFEELFVCGYLIRVIGVRYGKWPAIHASVAVRLLYHLYQGADGALHIIPVGLLFALWFVRERRLWPLMIAHAVLDMTALLGGTLLAEFLAETSSPVRK